MNLARKFAADDSSFATRAIEVADEYHALCLEQYLSFPLTTGTFGGLGQAAAARDQAGHFCDDIRSRYLNKGFAKAIAYHSSKDPGTGKCDAILVITCSGVATATLQRISSVDDEEKLPKSVMLVQGPKPEKLDVCVGETSYLTFGHSRKTTSDRLLQVPSSRAESSQNKLRNPFHSHPDGDKATQKEEIIFYNRDEQDLLLPVLLTGYKKRDESMISTSMNQVKMHQVSAITFLSALGITDQPVFGLVVNGTLGAITMAWKTNDVCAASVHHFRSDVANICHGT